MGRSSPYPPLCVTALGIKSMTCPVLPVRSWRAMLNERNKERNEELPVVAAPPYGQVGSWCKQASHGEMGGRPGAQEFAAARRPATVAIRRAMPMARPIPPVSGAAAPGKGWLSPPPFGLRDAPYSRRPAGFRHPGTAGDTPKEKSREEEDNA